MKKWSSILVAAAFAAVTLVSSTAQEPKPAPPKAAETPHSASQAKPGQEYSGMYSFLNDGEFVQLTVEDAGKVTGFVSRFGDGESNKDAFLDQYFRSGTLDGNKLSFVTETVQGVWFEFKGAVERGGGKNPGDEAYYVLKGTLADNTSDAQKKVTTHSSAVEFRRFPQDASSARNFWLELRVQNLQS